MDHSIANAPMPPAEDLKVRDRLLGAAIRLFTERGYAATSVSEIVAAAGVTKPILYYYFKNKEGIYLEILRHAYGRLEELLNQAQQWTGPATERIKRLAVSVHSLFIEHLEAARLIHAMYYGPRQGAPAYDYDAHMQHYIACLMGMVREGMAAGEFRALDPEDITLGAAGVIDIALDSQLCERGVRIDAPRLLRLLDMYFEGVVKK